MDFTDSSRGLVANRNYPAMELQSPCTTHEGDGALVGQDT